MGAISVQDPQHPVQDGVGVTPLVLKSWTGKAVTFDVVFTSNALPGDVMAFP